MKSYKDMSTKLDTLMEQLQGETIDIDDAIKTYEQAAKLIKEMEQYLASAENKISKIKTDLASDK